MSEEFSGMYDEPEDNTLTSIITFGKFKGKTVKEGIDSDAGYVKWMVDKTGNFPVNDEVKAYLKANNKPKQYGLGDILQFGKHKGCTIAFVLDEDPGWLMWAFENLESFDLSDEMLERVQEARSKFKYESHLKDEDLNF